eukprot:SAG31_NODE_15804_length_738_cov_1.039124_1_plen_245_part_11
MLVLAASSCLAQKPPPSIRAHHSKHRTALTILGANRTDHTTAGAEGKIIHSSSGDPLSWVSPVVRSSSFRGIAKICPPGVANASGRIYATHPSCGLVGDGVTSDSEALASCLLVAANCSRAIFFPPGQYWLPTTVVMSATNGTEGITLLGAGSGVSFLCKCANCSGGPSPPNYDQCGPTATGLTGPRGPVIQIGEPTGRKQTDGNQIDGFTIRGVDLGVYILHSAGVSMARSEVLAGAYDGGDMD